MDWKAQLASSIEAAVQAGVKAALERYASVEEPMDEMARRRRHYIELAKDPMKRDPVWAEKVARRRAAFAASSTSPVANTDDPSIKPPASTVLGNDTDMAASNGVDLAAPMPTTCSMGCSSCDASQESVLTSSAAPSSSTTVSNVAPESAAPVRGLDHNTDKDDPMAACPTLWSVPKLVSASSTSTPAVAATPWAVFALFPINGGINITKRQADETGNTSLIRDPLLVNSGLPWDPGTSKFRCYFHEFSDLPSSRSCPKLGPSVQMPAVRVIGFESGFAGSTEDSDMMVAKKMNSSVLIDTSHPSIEQHVPRARKRVLSPLTNVLPGQFYGDALNIGSADAKIHHSHCVRRLCASGFQDSKKAHTSSLDPFESPPWSALRYSYWSKGQVADKFSSKIFTDGPLLEGRESYSCSDHLEAERIMNLEKVAIPRAKTAHSPPLSLSPLGPKWMQRVKNSGARKNVLSETDKLGSEFVQLEIAWTNSSRRSKVLVSLLCAGCDYLYGRDNFQWTIAWSLDSHAYVQPFWTRLACDMVQLNCPSNYQGRWFRFIMGKLTRKIHVASAYKLACAVPYQFSCVGPFCQQAMEDHVAYAPAYPSNCVEQVTFEDLLLGSFYAAQSKFHLLYPEVSLSLSLAASSVPYHCAQVTAGMGFPYGYVSRPWEFAGPSLFDSWRAIQCTCKPGPSWEKTLLVLTVVRATIENCHSIVLPLKIMGEGTYMLQYLGNLCEKQYSRCKGLQFGYATYYGSERFAWEIAWFLVGTCHAYSDFGGSGHVISKHKLLGHWEKLILVFVLQSPYRCTALQSTRETLKFPSVGIIFPCVQAAKPPNSNGNCDTIMNQHPSLGLILLGVLEVWTHLTQVKITQLQHRGMNSWKYPRPSVHHITLKRRHGCHGILVSGFSNGACNQVEARGTHVNLTFLYIKSVNVSLDYACYFDSVRADNDYYYDKLVKLCLDYDTHFDLGEIMKRQVPWDPDGSTRHRLEVKPKFKEGGMLATLLPRLGLHLLGLGCSEATEASDYKYTGKGIRTGRLGLGWLRPVAFVLLPLLCLLPPLFLFL